MDEKNIIIKNGLNISQIKLENDILSLKEVKSCLIKGLENKNGDTFIEAILKLKVKTIKK